VFNVIISGVNLLPLQNMALDFAFAVFSNASLINRY